MEQFRIELLYLKRSNGNASSEGLWLQNEIQMEQGLAERSRFMLILASLYPGGKVYSFQLCFCDCDILLAAKWRIFFSWYSGENHRFIFVKQAGFCFTNLDISLYTNRKYENLYV